MFKNVGEGLFGNPADTVAFLARTWRT